MKCSLPYDPMLTKIKAAFLQNLAVIRLTVSDKTLFVDRRTTTDGHGTTSALLTQSRIAPILRSKGYFKVNNR